MTAAGVRIAALAAVAVVLGGCALWQPPRSDLELTWDKAQVILPGDARIHRMERVDVARRLAKAGFVGRLPVVVYLHGCTGIGATELAFGRRLTEQGLVFVAPNSFARRFRPMQCDPMTRTGGANQFVFDFRLGEVSYAVQRLKATPWADPDNLFLIGGSEGGVAAALYRGDAFKARVVFQWTCHGAPLIRGVGAPADTPVLAIVNRDDPWYNRAGDDDQAGDCGDFLADRPHSRSLVLDRGAVHGVLSDRVARQTIVGFIGDQLAR